MVTYFLVETLHDPMMHKLTSVDDNRLQSSKIMHQNQNQMNTCKIQNVGHCDLLLSQHDIRS